MAVADRVDSEDTDNLIAEIFSLTTPLINQTVQLKDYARNVVHKYLLKMKPNDTQEKAQFADYCNRIGFQFYMEGDLENAHIYLEWAVKLNPDFPEANYNFASVCEERKDESSHFLDQALYHYKIASQYINNRAAEAAINNLSRLLIINSYSELAIKMIDSILERVEDNMVKASLYKNKAWAYFEKPDYNQANENLLKCLELDKDCISAYYLLGKVQEAQGDKVSALKYWQKFLAFDFEQHKLRLPELNDWRNEASKALENTENT